MNKYTIYAESITGGLLTVLWISIPDLCMSVPILMFGLVPQSLKNGFPHTFLELCRFLSVVQCSQIQLPLLISVQGPHHR